MEEYNRLLEANNELLKNIKLYEDNDVEWNKKFYEGYFQFPFDKGEGVLAEYERMALDSIDIRRLYDKIKFNTKRGNEITEYMFITVNPDPKYNLSVRAMYDKLHKLCKSTRIIEYLFSIEQRGATKDEMGRGIHAHILIKHKFPKFCKLQQHFYNAFKTVIGNIKHIDIKYCKSVSDVIHRIEYIKGEKKDDLKFDKVEIDREWRRIWGIEDTYGYLEAPYTEN
jgi:hypothetical protein